MNNKQLIKRGDVVQFKFDKLKGYFLVTKDQKDRVRLKNIDTHKFVGLHFKSDLIRVDKIVR